MRRVSFPGFQERETVVSVRPPEEMVTGGKSRT
jgi:hypothetical protein